MDRRKAFFRRACLRVVIAESVAAIVVVVADGPGSPGFLVPFALLAMLANLPGRVVALALGLVSQGGWNPPPDRSPVLGFLTTFGIGAACWVALFWVVSRNLPRGDSEESPPEEDRE